MLAFTLGVVSAYCYAQEPDFRHVRWGWNLSEVEGAELSAPFHRGSEELWYAESAIADMGPAILWYWFTATNGLVGAGYNFFVPGEATDEQIARATEELRATLEFKYGSPDLSLESGLHYWDEGRTVVMQADLRNEEAKHAFRDQESQIYPERFPDGIGYTGVVMYMDKDRFKVFTDPF